MVSNKCILEDERGQKCISCSSSDVNCFKSVDSTDQIMINEMYQMLIPPQNVSYCTTNLFGAYEI